MKLPLSLAAMLLSLGVFCDVTRPSSVTNQVMPETTIRVPVGGNTWVQNPAGKTSVITKKGIENWTQTELQFATYLRINRPGTIKIALNAKTSGESKLQVSLNGRKKVVTVSGETFRYYDAGEWTVSDTGYLRINLAGLSKTRQRFAEVSDYEVSGTAVNEKTAYVKNDEGNFFYWGRRGPSVHLTFPFGDSINAKWFYNEVTVPKGSDVTGSYFMACGFGEGYFGMQVNSPTERRILFSVWSPFSTDDPKSIPQDQRISLLKKGEGVYTGEFGNEGSGGQSFLRYNWKAGETYKFLLKGEPDGDSHTSYTAYFLRRKSETGC